jgi:hypothetical protein
MKLKLKSFGTKRILSSLGIFLLAIHHFPEKDIFLREYLECTRKL